MSDTETTKAVEPETGAEETEADAEAETNPGPETDTEIDEDAGATKATDPDDDETETEVRAEREVSYTRVSDVMEPNVKTIERLSTVREAVSTMRADAVSSLVVERRDHSDEFGLLTVSDIATKVVAKDRSPDRVNVYEVMAKPVLTVAQDMNIRYAVRLLVKFGVSRALVLDEHRTPVGIITLRDMVLRYIGDKAG